MRKIQKALAAVFCAGVLITGIGTGISFLEFTSFSYEGEIQIGEVEMRTESFDYVLEPEEEEKAVFGNGRWQNGPQKLITDDSVPADTVRFQVTYNAALVTPFIQEYDDTVILEHFYTGNEIELFLSCKDKVLEGIKKRKIGSYQPVGITEVKILLNSELQDRVRLIY